LRINDRLIVHIVLIINRDEYMNKKNCRRGSKIKESEPIARGECSERVHMEYSDIVICKTFLQHALSQKIRHIRIDILSYYGIINQNTIIILV
jgi:hypothetical protein